MQELDQLYSKQSKIDFQNQHGQDRLIYRHRLWREAGLGRATTALIIGWRTARQVYGSSVHDQPSSTDLIAFIQLGQLGSQARGGKHWGTGSSAGSGSG